MNSIWLAPASIFVFAALFMLVFILYEVAGNPAGWR
jgi:hypothetical protein